MASKFTTLVSILIFTALSAHGQGTASTQTDKQRTAIVVPTAEVDADISLIEGRVVIVYDGDHLSVQSANGKVYSIRIQGIDAPEGEQDYGKKARKKLADTILNKEVKVIVHKKDMYDRYVGSVYINGQDVGLKMIESGMAWHFKRFSGEQAADVREKYARAELKARNERDGLWSDNAPMPPWEFREEFMPDSAESERQAAAESNRATIQNASVTTETRDSAVTPATTEAATPNTSGRTYIMGPRGGCYYLRPSGSKVYVKDKTLCQKP